MTPDDARTLIVRILHRTAPEFEMETLAPNKPLRDQMDIDSMDFLNAIIEIHERSGVDIPEADYPSLETLDGAIAYLVARG